METICVEIPKSMGDVWIVHSGNYMIIAPKEKAYNHKLKVVTEEELLKEEAIFKMEELIEQLNEKDKRLKVLKSRDYKNRALKASLTRVNKIINLLTKDNLE